MAEENKPMWGNKANRVIWAVLCSGMAAWAYLAFNHDGRRDDVQRYVAYGQQISTVKKKPSLLHPTSSYELTRRVQLEDNNGVFDPRYAAPGVADLCELSMFTHNWLSDGYKNSGIYIDVNCDGKVERIGLAKGDYRTSKNGVQAIREIDYAKNKALFDKADAVMKEQIDANRKDLF